MKTLAGVTFPDYNAAVEEAILLVQNAAVDIESDAVIEGVRIVEGGVDRPVVVEVDLSDGHAVVLSNSTRLYLVSLPVSQYTLRVEVQTR